LKESKYYRAVSGARRVNEWGIGFNPGDFHFESMVHPLAGFDDEKDAADIPLPRPVLLPDARDRVEAVKGAGYACVGTAAPVGGTVFWPAYKLRGMEQLLCDMISSPGYAAILFDRVTAITTEMAEAVTGAGADILWLADDFGTQRDLMMSPDMWRDWFKGRLARVVQAAKAKNPGILAALHSDGKIDPIIPDLIDIGIDILNPLQPECMDGGEIKRRFGDRLSFWGGIGTQTTMPFGSPEEVRRAVRSLIRGVGAGGGLLTAPTHVVEPEVPWDNILAFVEEASRVE
jgi:uroporphyrinogen decarboxylase